jgi:hypothetical protein
MSEISQLIKTVIYNDLGSQIESFLVDDPKGYLSYHLVFFPKMYIEDVIDNWKLAVDNNIAKQWRYLILCYKFLYSFSGFDTSSSRYYDRGNLFYKRNRHFDTMSKTVLNSSLFREIPEIQMAAIQYCCQIFQYRPSIFDLYDVTHPQMMAELFDLMKSKMSFLAMSSMGDHIQTLIRRNIQSIEDYHFNRVFWDRFFQYPEFNFIIKDDSFIYAMIYYFAYSDVVFILRHDCVKRIPNFVDNFIRTNERVKSKKFKNLCNDLRK